MPFDDDSLDREIAALVDRYGLQGARGVVENTLHGLTRDGLETFNDAITLIGDELPPPAEEGEVIGFGRYDDLGLLGVGGMGEVRRVRDRDLGRVVAMKMIRADLVSSPRVISRFREEAQVVAQLQHPGIPPVHDVGRLKDGRMWFTMQEIRGTTLKEVLRPPSQRRGTGWNLHRLIDVLATVADAAGYAHSRGVVHRDLKPSNVMLGEHGEVLVVDWGLAKVLGADAPSLTDDVPVSTVRSGDDSLRTRVGAVAGTAAYMPPEQARGAVDELDARTDVYALGAILYEVLGGVRAYVGTSSDEILAMVIEGPPPPLREVARGPLPDELASLCAAAMDRNPARRPPHGTAVADALRAWLAGDAVREKALEVVAQAEAFEPKVAWLRDQAKGLREKARLVLEDVPRSADDKQKRGGWALEDEADRMDREANRLLAEAESRYQGALTHVPELEEAHAGLVHLFLERHREAEASGDRAAVDRTEVRMNRHLDALRADHPARVAALAHLSGTGRLTLPVPEGTRVKLFRYTVRHRRLVPRPHLELEGPLDAYALPMGSWLCELSAEGRETVRYPVYISRGGHWSAVSPGEEAPQPVELPAAGTLEEGDCYVPAGWFHAGGDGAAHGGMQASRRLWCDGFVIQRFQVTHAEYLRFLNALVDDGRSDEALRHAPRRRGESDHLYAMEGDHFVLGERDWAFPWSPQHPAWMIDLHGAMAYAAWWADQTGEPWRLPCEYEWEKAARGVDGRAFPWGDFLDPSWCCILDSFDGDTVPAEVDSFPVDESPYGVRGMAGNVRDWCIDTWSNDGPPCPGDRVAPYMDAPSEWRVRRGGSWGDVEGRARVSDRDWYMDTYRFDYLGFRLVRTMS